MNDIKRFLSILLACIAASCLLVAAVFWLQRLTEQSRNENVLDDLRVSAEPSAAPTAEHSMAEASSASESAADGASSALEPAASDSSSASEAAADDSSSASEPAAGDSPSASESAASDSSSASEPAAAPVENPYKDSYLANADMAAWLQLPGTVIDYPVMWTPRDEEYYLKKGFDGKKNANGCLILDTDSCLAPLTTNLIIHGHNMKSGAMFGSLTDYEDESYFEEHRNIILYTEACQRNYEVIAVFRSQVYKKTDQVFKFYKFFQADTEEEFDDFYENIKALSLYDTGVTASFGDHFLTLSTCAYHVEYGRFVVVAKEVESGDSYLPVR